MEEQSPIDKKRDRGGQAEIGTEKDGAILEMYNLDGKLITIKEHALYEFFMADAIDPDRTNIDLPSNIQKIIINEGTESELVSCTFLTAKTLFKPEYFPAIDVKKAIRLSLDLLIELKELQNEIQSYLIKEKDVSDEYENRRGKPLSYSLPSIGNVETRCTTIFQKADRSEQILIEIIMLFYSSVGLKIQSHFPDFYEILKKKYGEDDTFSKFMMGTIEFMDIVRELRNCLDHRLPHVKVKDFELLLDTNILTPTIELKIRKTKLERIQLASFLPIVLKNFITISELTFAFIATKNAKPFIVPVEIRLIPEDKRRYKFLKYAFWSNLGEGGWYYQ